MATTALAAPKPSVVPSTRGNERISYAIEHIVVFGMSQGRLHTELRAPAPMRRETWTVLAIQGSHGQWRCRMTRQTPDGAASEPTFEISYRDPGNERDEGHCRITAYCGSEDVIITGRIWSEGRPVSVTYHGRLNSTQLEVYVQDQDNSTEPLLNEYASSLQELYDEHAEEVERYFTPLLKKLARRNLLGPGAADVYGVFQNVPADPASTSHLEKLLASMESPLPSQRETATAQLEKMGPAGILSALRYDAARLSPEQRGRLNAFIALHQRRINLSLARQDILFLSECLEHDDQRVREAAKQAIESLTGRKLAFDPAADFDARDAAAARLRATMRQGELSSTTP